MPYALILTGVVMVLSGVQNTYAALGTQLQTDGVAFIKPAAVIFGFGIMGYVPDLKGLSIAFLSLFIIALILANSKSGQPGFFGNLSAALNAGPANVGTTGNVTVTPSAPSGSGASTAAGAAGAITAGSSLASEFAIFGL